MNKYFINNFFSIVILGISIGWLVGMSVSPVIGVIIGSFMTIAASAVSILIGIQPTFKLDSEKESIKFNSNRYLENLRIWPLALLVITITVGSALGIFTRTHKYLGIEKIFEEENVSTIDKTKIDALGTNVIAPVLFAQTGSDVGSIIALHGKELKSALLALQDTKLNILVHQYGSDLNCLEMVKDILIMNSKK